MQAMVIYSISYQERETNHFTISIERREQRRREKELKDQEDASNGILKQDIFSLRNHNKWFYFVFIERKEQERKDKDRKDKEDASNGKFNSYFKLNPKFNHFTIEIERMEQERLEKERKDKEAASNGNILIDISEKQICWFYNLNRTQRTRTFGQGRKRP